jgi:TRAP-type C4-dicarboxylate transport system permease small subunit
MIKAKEWMEKISIVISSVMIAAMIIILFVNVVLRYIPGIGGFKWYMESSQYLNVWAMLLIGAQITVTGTHLKVEVLDSLVANNKLATKVVKVIRGIFITLFYLAIAYSGWMLASKAKQAISTMPSFTMGQVYIMFPIAGIICAVASVINIILVLLDNEKGGE